MKTTFYILVLVLLAIGFGECQSNTTNITLPVCDFTQIPNFNCAICKDNTTCQALLKADPKFAGYCQTSTSPKSCPAIEPAGDILVCCSKCTFEEDYCNNQSNEEKKGLSGWQIALIVISCVIFVIVCVFSVCNFFLKYR
ncbi:hypothetical protein DLAC_11044 [Tieghemostelium lacteum]|uniref:Transmembrane protein n=1 Tax=Tieghemostelium lacteum TaxID=361077 RepID=A0A151Z315_TIELA|nr:hypothetical protein DLAC_11044 [Tieghemostelium lacteum]|eukprot:KYQ88345.1 hypothetical protein DLAC_11044 [Tieghemostelium lacteum]